MAERTIANLIMELRNEQGINKATLCEGLCDVRTLTRLEMGEDVSDILLMDRLLQRLGKSPDMFEVVLSDDEYDGIVDRDEIEEIIDRNDIPLARKKLREYYETRMEPYSIQQQYVYQIQAVIESYEGNHNNCIEYLKSALDCTVPDFSITQKREVVLCVIEIELLIMLADEYYKNDNRENAEELITYLIDYIETNYTDKGEIVKIYPKAVYLYVSQNLTKDKCAENIEKCEKAFEYMIEEGTTIFLAEIMDLLISLYRELNIEKKARQLEFQLNALKEVFEEEGFEIYYSSYNMGWFKESLRRDYYLCSELIRGQRMALGLSQEELAYGIYENTESLARVETGKQMPNQKTFNMLMNRLGLHLGRYNGYLATDDYKVLELRKKINLLLSRKEWEEARIENERLRSLLDLTNLINRQYIETNDNYLNYKLGVIDKEEFYKRSVNTLELTYLIHKEILYRIPVKHELDLLNHIAISLWAQGEGKAGTELFERIEVCCEKSKVLIKHQLKRCGLILYNYTKALDDLNELQLADKYCKEGLKIQILAGKASSMDFYLSEKLCIAEKSIKNTEKKKKAMEKYLRQAFYISDLYKNQDNNSICDMCYRKIFNSDIEWY